MGRIEHRALIVVASLIAGVTGWMISSSTSLALLDTSESTAGEPATSAAAGWLAGSTEEKLAQIERHLRGLDVSMAEIGYRYGELLIAAKSENWEYAQYQTEKIDLSLRLALERRPQRAASSQPFLDNNLPPVFKAIETRDRDQLAGALETLHAGCVQCHQAENVLHFKEVVDRIKARSR